MKRATMRPRPDWSSPRVLSSMPSAAVTDPPGTPTAATSMKPSRMMKGRNVSSEGVCPLVRMVTTMADIVIAVAAPDRWTTLNRGMQKLTDSFRRKGTLWTHSRATGRVAALDIVPIAVK